MTTEDKVKDLIIKRYGNLMNFANECDLSYSTLFTILTRGFKKANVSNVIRICNTLNISTDALADDHIVFKDVSEDSARDLSSIETEVLNRSFSLDGEDVSDTEKDLLIDCIRFGIDLIRKHR